MLGDRLLADRAAAPGALALRLVLEVEQDVADVGVLLAGLRLAALAATFVPAAGARAGGTEVEVRAVGIGGDGRLSVRIGLNWNRSGGCSTDHLGGIG